MEFTTLVIAGTALGVGFVGGKYVGKFALSLARRVARHVCDYLANSL